MFLNYIKEFFVKKSLNVNLNNEKSEVFTKNVQTIGLLIDESTFESSEALIKEITLHGIALENIKVLAYREKFKEKESYVRPTFGKKHINWNGEITEDFVNEFLDSKFDLLLSYYDVENVFLMLVTSKSKAKFKVGFSAVDQNLNRLMINTGLGNYKLFVSELFRYLKNIK
ncbi:DUF6913 domain-containing protein [Flavobacterium nitrogenifigens]|uniref:Uncharacterized protein n=1 Tax=Flavobacterium nitrogenifigens TaxID=1617283 RepID=A0A521B8Y2_9FLAO|nr:hypothetical protein [Flavobacterium nitrogenifigens]KAF2335161.1 hypothetical protein DM397_06800 [Flavobacterium nitrogenifigens]SMO43568.1 hypothetical protein SAMN06265220_101754 [Flavobacterium nitrogenifigens]